MKRNNLYKFFDGKGDCFTVSELNGKFACDCKEFFLFDSCDHTLAIEEENKPIIHWRLVP